MSDDRTRANYVGAPQMFRLQNACLIINEAFDGYGCFLVGSALHKREWRDVDVRFIMSDEAFATLFPGLMDEGAAWMHARWSVICTAMADQLSAATGLPIDFQFQSQKFANATYSTKAGHRRSALGWFLTNDQKNTALPSPRAAEPAPGGSYEIGSGGEVPRDRDEAVNLGASEAIEPWILSAGDTITIREI